MISTIFSRLTILTLGTLYPAYNSFKAVRAKSVDEYLIWMIYWIVFAVFTAVESFTDIFLAWLPLYYELKVLMLLWLLPTLGNGSPVIYRKCLQAFFEKHEQQVDRMLVHLKEKGQDMLFHYISKAVMYVAKTVMDVGNHYMPQGILHLAGNKPIEAGKPKATKTAATGNAGDTDAGPSRSRSRGRRARQPRNKVELDSNKNEG